MKKSRIALIGAGNIGTALARGLISSGLYKPGDILMAEKRESRAGYLESHGFTVCRSSAEAIKGTPLVVISVKPRQFDEVVNEISASLKKDQIIISTVTGKSLSEIEAAFGKNPLVRIMPNTALEICQSMTCIAFRNVPEKLKSGIISMFDRMGRTLVIDDELMDASTVIGACGIAFALRFMRAMSQGGIEIGFNSEMAQFITAQTVKGAAGLILGSSNHPESEIDKVTTPQGITISGLNEMEHQGLSSAVIKGLTTSFSKLENLPGKSHR
ncbi:MAG TPA: pyrroline-5-carboxylate reductase [Bacteroidales bacterium]|nr:pyrroline-5-carboxylate reductase [Bacteroidales bacterium]